MEETTSTQKKRKVQPKTFAELLPDLALNGILSKDAMLTLTGQKKPRNTMAITLKPLTMAEMRAEIQAFKVQTPARAQPATSSKKKNWNSSIKVDKKVNHTGNAKRNNVVRKVLDFQPPKPVPPAQKRNVTNSRMTMMPPVSHSRMTMAAAVPRNRMTLVSSETPKFPKPEQRAKKPLYAQGRTNVRISGICNIPETPMETKPAKPRVTIADKENNSYSANMNRKTIAPKLISHKKLPPPQIPDTPISNDSWKSGSDASFIQKENEIHETERITNAILDAQHSLENIAEVSPPVATPFKKYRDGADHSNNSSIINNSHGENDTIMCFDNPAESEKVNAREESVIVSLCDMLNKASVGKAEHQESNLDELLEVERQTEHNIKMINNGIQVLANIKESQQKLLEQVRKMINEKRNCQKSSGNNLNETLTNENFNMKEHSPEKSPVLGQRCSVITKSTKSPTYKIPKRTPCLRKRVFHKSMPNFATDMSTPIKLGGGKALNMYMEMKEQWHFLHTPLVRARPAAPDTPALTSNNLKMQLNKLYGS